MDKLIITAAICGAEVTKEQNPNVPYTVEEIVREAKSAVDAGAAIVHLHVRWDDGTPTQDRARFQECEEAILKVCPNVILIPSTGGAVGMTPDERLQSTDTTPLPEMATLDCGTCNFGDEIFDNTMPTMRAFGKRMIERGWNWRRNFPMPGRSFAGASFLSVSAHLVIPLPGRGIS
jgi:3-keto-5-aminohexanoate cleavage enzyme